PHRPPLPRTGWPCHARSPTRPRSRALPGRPAAVPSLAPPPAARTRRHHAQPDMPRHQSARVITPIERDRPFGIASVLAASYPTIREISDLFSDNAPVNVEKTPKESHWAAAGARLT